MHNICSLELRRLRSDFVFCYNTLHGLNGIILLSIGLHLNCNIRRGLSLKLIVPHARLNIRSNFFSNWVVLAWNSLEPALIEAPTSQLFWERVTKVYLHRFTKCFYSFFVFVGLGQLSVKLLEKQFR